MSSSDMSAPKPIKHKYILGNNIIIINININHFLYLKKKEYTI